MSVDAMVKIAEAMVIALKLKWMQTQNLEKPRGTGSFVLSLRIFQARFENNAVFFLKHRIFTL